MAVAATMPHSNLKNLTFPSDVASISTKPSAFGQVTLKRKSETLISTKRSRITSTLLLAPLSPASTSKPPTKQSQTCLSLSRVWRQLQGCNNWENLVEPLHPLLRQEIIRYGEFVTACYKAFDLDPSSKRYLNCKFGKKNMLREVGLEGSGYAVTKYIYATPDISIPIQNGQSCGRWIGYVAVSSDEESKRLGRRDVTITFRGTVTNPEWVANMMSSLTPARLDPHNPRPDVKVEAGFLSLYTSDETSTSKFGLGSCREQLLSEVSRLINKYRGEEMSITLAGHSMGSSLALLLAYDLAELGLNKRDCDEDIPITVFSFGGPRVGNSSFKERCEELGVKVLRIVNVNDPITKLPGVFLNENFRVLGGTKFEFPWSYSCYAHVGIELALDFFKMDNPSCVHDLETYINLLRCPKGLKFRREAGRDLVNRARGILLSSQNVDRAKEILFNAQNFDTLPWINAACNLVNFVQSQMTY